MNHYIVKLDVQTSEEHKFAVTNTQLIKATHPEKAIEIASRSHEVADWYTQVISCTKIHNVDVSIIKAYLS